MEVAAEPAPVEEVQVNGQDQVDFRNGSTMVESEMVSQEVKLHLVNSKQQG